MLLIQKTTYIYLLGLAIAILLLFSCKHASTTLDMHEQQLSTGHANADDAKEKDRFRVTPVQYDNWKGIAQILWEENTPSSRDAYTLMVDTFEEIKRNDTLSCKSPVILKMMKGLQQQDKSVKRKIETYLAERGYTASL